MKSYFIFSTRDGYYIVESKDVDKIPKPRELVRRANAVEVLREYAEKEGIVFAVDKAMGSTWGIRKKKVRGAANPLRSAIQV